MRVAVLTVSDRVSRGEAEDGSGDTLEQLLSDDG
jgi:molybdopterin biosynthesis enzyme MoaB